MWTWHCCLYLGYAKEEPDVWLFLRFSIRLSWKVNQSLWCSAYILFLSIFISFLLMRNKTSRLLECHIKHLGLYGFHFVCCGSLQFWVCSTHCESSLSERLLLGLICLQVFLSYPSLLEPHLGLWKCSAKVFPWFSFCHFNNPWKGSLAHDFKT